MKRYKDYNKIMHTVYTMSELKNGSGEVETVHKVFKEIYKYMSPEINRVCSKTASDIAYYIYSTIKHNQTSIKVTSTNLIESNLVKSKSKTQIHNAFKELLDIGVLVRWSELDLPNTPQNISKSWYLLNPLMIKAIKCKDFESQVEVTYRRVYSGYPYNIDEFSALVYDFNK